MKKVLFVCVENSCRSQMAEAFAHMHGQGIIEPFSAGSRPSGIVNPKAVRSMEKAGYDLTSHRSKALDDIPNIEYDVIITMGCGDTCPSVKARKRIDWHIPDPKNMDPHDFDTIRVEIEGKVKEFTNTLLDHDE